MVSPSRSSASPRQRDNAGKIVVGVLILLGLIASVFLIFSNNVQLVRVGLVAALWAAAVAALAATRYRRDAAIDQAKARDLQKVYELQLEREITARREYELGVESRVRREVGADAAELAALRGELTVLRESLQRLFDGDLLVDRPALRAEAVRVQALTRATVANGSSQETDTWDAWSAPAVPLHVVSPVFDPDHPEPPAFASPYDDPVTAETAVVSAEASDEEGESPVRSADDEDPDNEVDRDRLGATAESGQPDPSAPESSQPRSPESESSESESSKAGSSKPESSKAEAAGSASAQPARDGQAGTGATAVKSGTASANETSQPATADSVGSGDSRPNSSVPRLAPLQPATTMGTAGSRRRRHADSDEDQPGRKITVAEIMANLRSEQNSSS
ncbi:hypothetical protein IRT45_34175 [Nocardia sp. BSTN01]|uniref:DUF6779 domain-containing protein n=1 Tax=Nocardia sp. BSTN01 TaxID=2783665 RepID=UPI00189094F3|nr:DUF6779 domain-containing protein [Nocardia sp. BSTN01]MBF5002166.1 hypothetical protein [Nocardia sp. BSTN01]